jgi:hypothetical protein
MSDESTYSLVGWMLLVPGCMGCDERLVLVASYDQFDQKITVFFNLKLHGFN